VGSNAAVYAFLQGLTHPNPPVRDSDRIVSIFGQDRSRENGLLSPDEFWLLEKSQGLFDWVGAARIKPGEATMDGRTQIETVSTMTRDLAEALSMPLDKGAVISHRVWENTFSSREGVIGSVIRINNADFRISGVAPEQLDGLYNNQGVEVWIESSAEDLQSGGRDRRDLWVLARLRHGISAGQAQVSLRSHSAGIGEVSVMPYTGISPTVARGLARVGLFLNFSAAAVFFIACINVASFLLGRALKRSHETSLRIALGATRTDLLCDLFTDSAVLSVAGGVMGALLGTLTARALPAFLFEQDAERLSFAPHLLPILMASMVCIAVTVACGMMPVAGTVTDRPWMVLQRETGSPSKAIRRLRSALVVGQITACCMLLTGTALLLSGLHGALKTSAGHRLGDPILLTVQAPTRPDGPEIDVGYFTRVEKIAKAVPGLFPMAWTARLPGNQPLWRTFRIQQLSRSDRDVAMDISWLTPSSLQSLLSPPIAGRMFNPNDQGRRVAVVNEEAAAELYGRLTAGVVIRDSASLPIEIIGVTKNRSKDAKQRPTIYYGYINQLDEPGTIRNAQFRVPRAPFSEGVELSTNVISADYPDALDMTLIAGRRFREEPIAGQGRVGWINQEAADLYFNGKPIGAGIIDEIGVRTEIIGVVKSQVFGTFEQHGEPAIYFPLWQDCPPRITLMLRHSKWSSSMAADLLNKIGNIPGNTSTPVITTLDSQLAQSGLAGLRIATLIGSVSAVAGLLLSILGLLSAQSDTERQRQRERALCIALGAQRWRVVLMVLNSAARLALLGTLIGAALSFTLVRFLLAGTPVVASPPFQVWLIAPLLPAAAVMIASMVPARRAAAVSPATALRDN
jgi:ABC-type antimicrobial peptide transport system permease subunit